MHSKLLCRSTIYKPKASKAEELPTVGPEWIKKKPRHLHRGALLAAAVSSDGQLLAVGGGDRRVHVWDTRTDTLIQSFPGHKDTITGKLSETILECNRSPLPC